MNRKQRKAKLAKARHHSKRKNPFKEYTSDFIMRAAHQKPMMASTYMMYEMIKYLEKNNFKIK